MLYFRPDLLPRGLARHLPILPSLPSRRVSVLMSMRALRIRSLAPPLLPTLHLCCGASSEAATRPSSAENFGVLSPSLRSSSQHSSPHQNHSRCWVTAVSLLPSPNTDEEWTHLCSSAARRRLEILAARRSWKAESCSTRLRELRVLSIHTQREWSVFVVWYRARRRRRFLGAIGIILVYFWYIYVYFV